MKDGADNTDGTTERATGRSRRCVTAAFLVSETNINYGRSAPERAISKASEIGGE